MVATTVSVIIRHEVISVYFFVCELDSLSALMHKSRSITVLAFLEIHGLNLNRFFNYSNKWGFGVLG